MDPHTEQPPKIKVALAGLGKMGLSHHAILNMHPRLELVAVCDSASYLLDVMTKYTGIRGYSDYGAMLEREAPEAVVIATPSSLHEKMVGQALDRDMHVFCEKPFCLDVEEGARLVEEAERRGLVNQVGYHNRFLATFEKARNLVASGVIGEIYHASAECYGPVVLRKPSTWRAHRNAGGGCLYDYACHGIDLIHFLIGQPAAVRGSTLRSVFSSDAEDEVYANLNYADGKTAQISANWSDDSFRKMSTRISLWGTRGKLIAGQQELNVFLRPQKDMPGELGAGWTTLYTTALTRPVWFYLRGEEYSAQIDHFAQCITQRIPNKSDFRSAHATDVVADWIRKDAARESDHIGTETARLKKRTVFQEMRKSLGAFGFGTHHFPRG